ncbi:MAG: putative RND superfamily exporter protein/cytochrome P450 [Oceanicoccus sp.]|jgi:predicted RND superfamily exporter protein/cytochrome P450
MPLFLLDWTLSKPKQVLFWLFMLIVFACMGFKNVALDASYKSFFDDDDPLLLAMNQQENTYSKYDNMLIVVGVEQGDIFTPSALHALQQLTNGSWQLPYSSRVDSIINYNHIQATEDELLVAHLFETDGVDDLTLDDFNEYFPAQKIAHAKKIIMSTPSLLGNYIAHDGAAATVFITFEVSDNPLNEPDEISQKLHQLVDGVRASHPELTFHVTGTLENSVAFMDATIDDIKTLIPVAYLIMVVLLVLLMRSVWATIITLSIVSFVTLITMGLKTWVNGDINSINSFAPTMIMTIAVADCVHILVSFFQYYRSGNTKNDAMRLALNANFKAVLLTSITTAIGFACLNFHASPLYRELGNIVAVGVMVAFVLSVTVLPALVVLLPIKSGGDSSRSKRFMLAWSHIILLHSKKILVLATVGIILLIALGLPKNELNEMFTEYLDKSFSFRQANYYLNDHIGGLHRLLYSVDSGSDNNVHSTEYLNVLEAFSNWLRQQPEVAFVGSYSDVQKRINKAMNGDQSSYYRITDNAVLASQYSLLYELSLPYGQGLTNIVSFDKSSSLVICILYETDSNTIISFNDKAEQWLKQNAPEPMHSTGTGLDLMFSKMAQQNIPAMVFGTFFTMLLISAILVIALRSWSLGLISVLTNILPALLAFSFWGLVDSRIGIGVAAVATLTLGLVVDDTIHFLHRFKQARLAGLSVENAITQTLSTTGMAMLTITLVFAGGFAALSFSHYSANADLGLMTAVTIIIAVVMDLIVLPAFLIRFYANKNIHSTSINQNGLDIPKPQKGLLGHLPLMAHGEHGCLYDSLLKVRKEQGDIFQLDILNKPWVVVSDAQMIQKILITQREQFPKTGDAVDEMKAIGGDLGILVTEGQQWLRQRQLVMPAFRPEQLKSMMVDMNAISHRAVAQLGEDIDVHNHSTEIEGSDYLNRIALAIICHVGFDYRIESFKADANVDPLLEAQELQCKELMKRIQRTKYWKQLPLPSNYRLDKMMKIQHAIFSDIIKQHAEGKAESKVLMHQLMTALDDDGNKIAEEELIQLVHGFIAAGHETSGAFLQWTLYYLATHPQLQQDLRDEVNNVMGNANDVTYEHYQNMPIMDKVLKESLRLRPPIPIMLRSASEDLILEGYNVKKDTPILIMLGALQKDKKYWGDKADFFDISHFDETNEKQRERFVYAPFGLGPRVCVGHRFAMIEATVIMAQLLRTYRFSWVEGQTVKPILSLVWTTKQPMRFKVERINHVTANYAQGESGE